MDSFFDGFKIIYIYYIILEQSREIKQLSHPGLNFKFYEKRMSILNICSEKIKFSNLRDKCFTF